MKIDYRRLLASAGVFLGVLLIMCLTAKLVIKYSGVTIDGVVRAQADNSGNPFGELDIKGDSAEEGNFSGNNGSSEKTGDKETGNSAGNNVPGNDPSGNGQSGSNTSGNESKANGSAAGNTSDIETGNAAGSDVNGGTGTQNTDAGNNGSTGTNDNGRAGIRVICVDAAHQAKADSSTEPIGPGARTTKEKCTSGATGSTGVTEHSLNLAIALKLRDELTGRGYAVIMIRDSADVSVSEATRAKTANDTSDLVVHIHCNADDRPGISGIMAFEPGEDNSFVSGSTGKECRKLGTYITSCLASSTGAKNWGVIEIDTLTALNWTTIPSSHVEVGYLTNEDEEKLLVTGSYQDKIAKGIADGIDAYFAGN